jgi:hypothetical protein
MGVLIKKNPEAKRNVATRSSFWKISGTPCHTSFVRKKSRKRL